MVENWKSPNFESVKLERPCAIITTLLYQTGGEQVNKLKRSLPSVLAFLAIALLASLAPAYATSITGPLGGTADSTTGTPVAIDIYMVTVSDASLNNITYIVEVAALVKNASLGDVVSVVFYVNATCQGTCPNATIGLWTPNVHGVNHSGGSVTLGTITANTNASLPTDGPPVQILSGNATLNGFPTNGRNTVALLGSVVISAMGFPDVEPDFSIAWFNSGK
jgi:hypothetical protein